MSVEHRKVGDVSVVDVAGRITLGRGDRALRDKVSFILEGEQKKIVLNLQAVTYLDSAALAALISCQSRAVERGAAIKLAQPPRRVVDLLELARLDELFETFDSESEALDSFGSRRPEDH